MGGPSSRCTNKVGGFVPPLQKLGCPDPVPLKLRLCPDPHKMSITRVLSDLDSRESLTGKIVKVFNNRYLQSPAEKLTMRRKQSWLSFTQTSLGSLQRDPRPPVWISGGRFPAENVEGRKYSQITYCIQVRPPRGLRIQKQAHLVLSPNIMSFVC